MRSDGYPRQGTPLTVGAPGRDGDWATRARSVWAWSPPDETLCLSRVYYREPSVKRTLAILLVALGCRDGTSDLALVLEGPPLETAPVATVEAPAVEHGQEREDQTPRDDLTTGDGAAGAYGVAAPQERDAQAAHDAVSAQEKAAGGYIKWDGSWSKCDPVDAQEKGNSKKPGYNANACRKFDRMANVAFAFCGVGRGMGNFMNGSYGGGGSGGGTASAGRMEGPWRP